MAEQQHARALTPGRTRAEEREDFVVRYLPLVKRVAHRIAVRLPGVDVDELISAGCVGLLNAVERFDVSRGKPFEAFAEWRIKGAILDELRGHDHMTRPQRHLVNKINRVRRTLEARLGPDAVDAAAVAAELGLEVAQVEELLGRSESPGFVSLGDFGAECEEIEEVIRAQGNGQAGPPDPYQSTYLRDLKQRLVKALAALPERERLVLTLYYAEGLTYKEIAAVLDRTESRVCQIAREAVEALQAALDESRPAAPERGPGPVRPQRRPGRTAVVLQ